MTLSFLQHKCDLINMSYGEPTSLPDYGRFVDLVNEVSNPNLAISALISVYLLFCIYSFTILYAMGYHCF
jgi:hypothetical protein